MTSSSCFSLLGAALLVSSCATGPVQSASSPVVYSPKGQVSMEHPYMTVFEARNNIAMLFQYFHGVRSGNWNLTVALTTSQFSVVYQPTPKNPQGQAATYTYVFKSPYGLVVRQDNGNYFGVYNTPTSGLIGWYDRESSVLFVDAVLSIEHYYTSDHTADIAAELEKFKPTVKSYVSKARKPALPEESRRFQIRAEAAFDAKNYDEAIHGYEEALEVAPWWPEGHYNVATIMAQLGLFPDAILEMRKYLALSPGAKDARQATDKIYAWEAKLEPR